MEWDKGHAAQHAEIDKLVAELVQHKDYEVPESLVDRQIDLRLERGLRALAAQGMKMEDLKKMDLPRLRVGQRHQAVQDVKTSFFLEHVADLEKNDARGDEANTQLANLAHHA